MGFLVYRYGLRPPVEGADDVERQMRAAHDLRNALTEIERGRRAAVRATTSSAKLRSLEVGVAKLLEHELDLARALREGRASGATEAKTKELRTALRHARSATKEARDRLIAARRDARSVAKYQKIEKLAQTLRKDAYKLAQQEVGINWGGRYLAEAAVDAARSSLRNLYEADGVTPLDPKFRRWDGSGQVTVQLVGNSGEGDLLGLAVSNVFGDNPRLRIGPATALPRTDGRQRKGSADALRTLWLRIGSHEDHSPIWAKFPMRLHRPLPDHGVIKRATVTRTMRGPRAEWTLELTIDTTLAQSRQLCGHGAVSVHFGWRAVDGGIRVATWLGEDGESGKLVLDGDVIGSLRKPNELRARRDREFNEERERLLKWMAGRVLPPWLSEASRALKDWRATARLASLCRRWRTARFEDDEEGYDGLERWRYRDYHLWTWESNQRIAGERYRRDIFRKFAASLARRYATLVIEDFELSRPARYQPDESERREVFAGRSNRVIAAPSVLRSILEHAFCVRNGSVTLMPAAPVTTTCHACGAAQEFDSAEEVLHACRDCSATWDQDDNAAINILRAHLSNPSSAELAKTQRPAGNMSRWVKRRIEKQERSVVR